MTKRLRENIAATIMLYKDFYCLKPKNKSALGLYATQPRAPADEGPNQTETQSSLHNFSCI